MMKFLNQEELYETGNELSPPIEAENTYRYI